MDKKTLNDALADLDEETNVENKKTKGKKTKSKPEKKKKDSKKESPSKTPKVKGGLPIGGSIVVDLTPADHRLDVETAEYKRKWIFAFGIILTISGLATGFSFAQNAQSVIQKSGANTEMKLADQKLSEYADDDKAVQGQKIVEGYLYDMAGQQINWKKVIRDFEDSMPSGAHVTALSLGVSDKGKDREANGLIVVSTNDPMGYSDSYKQISNISGIHNVEIGGMKNSSGADYTFSLTFSYDKAVLTAKYPNPDSKDKVK